MTSLFLAPTVNFKQTTLNGSIDDSVTTITLTSTTNLQAPGVVVIDRVDSAGAVTDSAREVVSYTGISGSDLTGVTREVDSSTAQAHGDGAVVETAPTVGMWNSLATILDKGLSNDGYLKAIASPVSIAIMKIKTELDVSGASVNGSFPIHPTFNFIGSISGPTTLVQTPLSMPHPGDFQWFSVMTRTVASGASLVIDMHIDGVSIFDTIGRPTITGAGTFVSTASIKTKSFTEGARLSWDVDTAADKALHITDFVIQGKA